MVDLYSLATTLLAVFWLVSYIFSKNNSDLIISNMFTATTFIVSAILSLKEL